MTPAPVKQAAGKKPLSRSLRLYQRIAVAFVVVTFLLLLTVLYLSVSRATIKIVANPKVVSVNAVADIVTTPDEEGEISGAVALKRFEKSQTFTLPQEGATAVEAKAAGTVTIINESGSAQPLVATTRVLADNGVLFRLDKAVTVPAGGKVTASVKADVAGKSGEIGPSHFIIPGLNATLQQKIYATSDSPMVGGVQFVRSLTEKDVSDAVTTLTEQILTEAKTALSEGVDRTVFDGESYFPNVVTKTTSVPVGTETGTFSLTLGADVSAVFYNKELVETYGNSLLRKRLPEGYELIKENTEGMQVKVEAIDTKNKEARISVYLDGTSRISEEAPSLAKDRFVGRAPNEVLTLLRSNEAVQDVSVTFTPFWLKRVPTLKDHIKIQIEDPK
jgi:hypothetical protein